MSGVYPQTVQAATTLKTSRSACRIGMVICVVVFPLFGTREESASAAVFRVDDSTLTVPAILSDDWRAVKAQNAWARAGGEAISGEPRLSRFLARDYQFTLNGESLRLKTTWFAGGKCISTDESVSTLSPAKRNAIEMAFGSLNEINRRLQGESADGSEGHVVIWASFMAKPDVSVPVESLAPDDLAKLSPFAELAKQSFEARLFSGANCKESVDPVQARDSARSGGRRMQPSRSQRTTSSRGTPRPTGSMAAGALPQAAAAPSRNLRQTDGGDSNGDKQKWGFLISQYVAEPGSLVFNLAGQFTRCVSAKSEAAAFSLMRATYRPLVSASGGRRISYTVAPSTSASCEGSGGGDSGVTDGPDNFESPGPGDSPGSGPTVDPGGAAPFAPFPDPLEVEPSPDGSAIPDRPEDFDFESIPVSAEPEEETPLPEAPDPMATESVES
jgi:hypothetical protein